MIQITLFIKLTLRGFKPIFTALWLSEPKAKIINQPVVLELF